uniref:Elongation of very long chain fatty acids protein n=1 Tax=Timema douglasi TaxID=61478 RepID=A0A7R8VRP7_TIMDO|nr:unnamed protein product [Timema douglasi]
MSRLLNSSGALKGYLASGWAGHYSFRCQPVDYSNNPMALRLFFILRKKNTQVSNLHVIHHGCMPMSVWLGMKFAPGGHSTFFALLNTFVHIIMYFYYMMSAMGPQFQRFLWWKKYLTTLQMAIFGFQVQFVLIFGHQFQLLFTECNYPKGFMVWIGLHGVLFLFLFSDFYKAKYGGRKASSHNGACMPVLDEKKVDDNGNGVIARNGVVTNGNAPASVSDKVSIAVKLHGSNTMVCVVSGNTRGVQKETELLKLPPNRQREHAAATDCT